MKTIKKLRIDPKKLLKDQELRTLKGGMICWSYCSCSGSSIPPYESPFQVPSVVPSELINVLYERCESGNGTCSFAGCA